jgi:hypothetical protein
MKMKMDVRAVQFDVKLPDANALGILVQSIEQL